MTDKPEQAPQQPPPQPPTIMLAPDPEYRDAAARVERDGLSQCLARVQLQLSEQQELVHLLKRDLSQAQAKVARLQQELAEAKGEEKPTAPAAPPNRAARRRAAKKANGKGKRTPEPAQPAPPAVPNPKP